MYIEPKTNIKLLSNVPLDTTYEHTLSWEAGSTGVIAQNTYFVSKTKYNLTDYNYVRVANGVARVGIQAENLYDCNYMMFQNTAFGNKWFYAFVTDIVYLNNGTSEIRFTIDDLQTWYFNFELDDCFIEREHTATDVIGEHIEAEPVSVGEYVMNDIEQISTDDGVATNIYAIILAITYTPEEQVAGGNIVDLTYTGSTLFAFESNSDGVEAINKYIGNFATAPDTVTNIYMCPTLFLPTNTHYNNLIDVDGGHLEPISGGGRNPFSENLRDGDVTSLTSLDGYTDIRNKKLFTFPYNFYNVIGGDSCLQLRYEFFKDNIVNLKGYSVCTYPPSITYYPYNYKGLEGSTYYAESISLANYPVCSWNIDAYKVYVAQNTVPDEISAVTTGISAGMQIGLGAVPSGVSTVTGYISDLLTRHYKASIEADIYKGNFSTGCNASANGNNNLIGGQCSITHQQAKIIDDFFTKYGYAVNVVKKPDWRSRPHYNYIKTVNCTATGSIPSDSMRNICHLFDNGITFWKNPEEVGQYTSVNNRV